MALRKFIIERDIPAVGSLEREQLRGAAAQSDRVPRKLGAERLPRDQDHRSPQDDRSDDRAGRVTV